MRYVMSDIHGMYDKFIEMLKEIDFKDEDELFILGDVMDRGPDPLKIIDIIVSKKNIHMIKGNHEAFLLDYVDSGNSQVWLYNGGYATLDRLMERGQLYMDSLCEYLRKLPLYFVVDKFILVHAGIYMPKNANDLTINELLEQQDEEFMLWNRSNIGYERKFKDYTIICGHTPVQTIERRNMHNKILYREGHIYIDCGASFEKDNTSLACLRLDDLKEFYV